MPEPAEAAANTIDEHKENAKAKETAEVFFTIIALTRKYTYDIII